MKMILPTRDHILIELTLPETETKTSAGIILKTSQTKPRQTVAKVIAVGEGRTLEDGTLIPCRIQPNDQVIFYDYAGVAVQLDDQEPDKSYLIIKQNDVLAVVTER